MRNMITKKQQLRESAALQASPEQAVNALLGPGAKDTGALAEALRESGLAHWQKADAYYYCNIARVQRIWQARIVRLLYAHASQQLP